MVKMGRQALGMPILFLVFACAHAAANSMEIPFNSVGKKVVLSLEAGPCAIGDTPLILETDEDGKSYRVVCKVGEPFRYDSTIVVKLVENFNLPNSIVKDVQSSVYFDDPQILILKSKGKLYSSIPHKWGKEYQWSTPTEGASLYRYLCPNKASFCFKIQHGAVDQLKVDVVDFK